MPLFHLTAIDDTWAESLSKHRTREAAYRATLEAGAGDYIIFLSDERDREVVVDTDGNVLYRVPGTTNWHAYTPES